MLVSSLPPPNNQVGQFANLHLLDTRNVDTFAHIGLQKDVPLSLIEPYSQASLLKLHSKHELRQIKTTF